MCDTFGRIIKQEEYAIFAKNSDRKQNEPQILQFLPAKKHKNKYVQTTYIKIPQVKETYAAVVSRPTWMWGAEMGVNEFGVCVGNEALYASIYDNPQTGLLGMDLLRLSLERSKTAAEALDTIITLLTTYGQGGFCDKDGEDVYDNSFLIMDINELYILETKNKNWAYKKLDKGCISNCFTITSPDKFCGVSNFKKKFSRNYKISGDYRLKLMKPKVNRLSSVSGAIDILRLHNKKDQSAENKKHSVCMHGKYCTTASMVVELVRNCPPKIYFTGGSNPCVSLFKPFVFGENVIKPINEDNDLNYDYWTNINSKKQQKLENDQFKQRLYEVQNKILDNNLTIKESLHLEEILYNSK